MLRKKETSKKRKYKNVQTKNEGITLIALVITIIVILILAGVSINTLFGDNGLLTKAQQAADANSEAGAYDKVATEIYASYDNSGKLNESTLRANLKRAGGTAANGGEIEESTTGFPIAVKMDKFLFIIEENGNVTRTNAGEWIQIGNKIITIDEEKGEITTVEVGDTITGYDPKTDENGKAIIGEDATVTSYSTDNGYDTGDRTYDLSDFGGGWIVLGAEDGQLIITTDDVIKAGGDFLTLYGAKGYAKGIGELDKISKLYGQGKYADKDKTRSINVEDINKVTGYYPMRGNEDRTGPANQGLPYEYGNKMDYTIENGKVKYKKHTENEWKLPSTDITIFHYPSGDGTVTELGEGEIKTFENNYYIYYPQSLSTSSSNGEGTVKDEEGNKAYKALFKNNIETKVNYWLGSQYYILLDGTVCFGIGSVNNRMCKWYGIFRCRFR